jgi:pimeloyl-ACP methyl ester carboxylesterase
VDQLRPPMKFELISAVPGVVASLRIVLIPGANQAPEDLQTAGFLTAVHDRRLNIDMVLVAPQLAHLTDRSVLTRLHTEVVLPARSAGCLAVWFAGISLGGFLTLLYAADHPTQLDGLCLLAPYLGNRMITAEIKRFQSLADWSAEMADAQDELAEERRIWRYIADHPPYPPAVRYLGYGRDDRFATTQRLLASQLPPVAVDVIDGGHEWRVWRQLWDRFLDRFTGAAPEFL